MDLLLRHYGSDASAMDALQDAGLVSDEAVHLADCATADLDRAAALILNSKPTP